MNTMYILGMLLVYFSIVAGLCRISEWREERRAAKWKRAYWRAVEQRVREGDLWGRARARDLR